MTSDHVSTPEPRADALETPFDLLDFTADSWSELEKILNPVCRQAVQNAFLTLWKVLMGIARKRAEQRELAEGEKQLEEDIRKSRLILINYQDEVAFLIRSSGNLPRVAIHSVEIYPAAFPH